jgi:hypothetical protein
MLQTDNPLYGKQIIYIFMFTQTEHFENFRILVTQKRPSKFPSRVMKVLRIHIEAMNRIKLDAVDIIKLNLPLHFYRSF